MRDSDSPIPVRKQNQNLISPDNSADEVASNKADKASNSEDSEVDLIDNQYFAPEVTIRCSFKRQIRQFNL